ncbi:unnamed protein product [Bubo scandiacus]
MAAVPPDSWQPPTVSMETTMGPLVLELTSWCRGDPTGTGRGGASIYGKQFEDELHPELKFTGAGILAMANAGPDTNGSQFFLTLGPAQWLDGKHSIFGRVCQGMGVLGRLAMVETNAQDRPLDDVKVIKAFPSG